jgi:hypothetical protein
MSQRLYILGRLTTLLEGITHDGVSLVGRVHRGRSVYADETPVPCLGIIEAPRPDDAVIEAADDRLRRVENWTLLIQGWVADDKMHPTDPVYPLLEAVERKIVEVVARTHMGNPVNPSVFMFGGAVTGMRLSPGVVRPPQNNVSSRAFFYLPVTLNLPVDLAAPFNPPV